MLEEYRELLAQYHALTEWVEFPNNTPSDEVCRVLLERKFRRDELARKMSRLVERMGGNERESAVEMQAEVYCKQVGYA